MFSGRNSVFSGRCSALRASLVAALGGGARAVPDNWTLLMGGVSTRVLADFSAADQTRAVLVRNSGDTYYAPDAIFSNAGTGPKKVFDATGVMVWSPHNMAIQSEALDNAAWNKGSCTVSANAVASPIDGAVTADKIVTAAASGFHQVTKASAITLIPNESYAFGVRAKAAGWGFAYLNANDGAEHAASFNLSTGVRAGFYTGNTGNPATASASLGNSWYSLAAVITAGSTVLSPSIGTRLITGDFSSGDAGDGSSGIYAVGAQVNRGASLTAYLATTTAARFGLGIDYDSVTLTCKGLRVEPASTNILLNSASFSTQSVSVTAQAYTLSFFGTGTVTLSGVSSAGPLVGTGAGNRVSVTFTPTAGTLTLTVSGSVTNAQLEAGSIATSYYPSLAAAGARAADAVNVPTSALPWSATEGTVYLWATTPAYSGGTNVLWQADDGTADNRICIVRNSSNRIRCFVTVSGVEQIASGLDLGSIGNSLECRVIFGWKANEFGGSLNGGYFVTASSGSIPTVTTFKIGYSATAGEEWNGIIQKLAYLPAKLAMTEAGVLLTEGGTDLLTEDGLTILMG